MQSVTASELRQNSMLLQNALREDLLITKRDKPFVVVMDYQKYQELEKYINKIANDETYRAIENLENDRDILTYHSKEELFGDLGI
jgi:prevent-host-death family protein